MAVGGMCGCRGHVWLQLGVHCVAAGGACVGYNEIRSMSEWYTSYWNAFLFSIIGSLDKLANVMDDYISKLERKYFLTYTWTPLWEIIFDENNLIKENNCMLK